MALTISLILSMLLSMINCDTFRSHGNNYSNN